MDASCKRYGDYQSMLSRDLRECSSTYIAAKDGTIHLPLMLFSERRENQPLLSTVPPVSLELSWDTNCDGLWTAKKCPVRLLRLARRRRKKNHEGSTLIVEIAFSKFFVRVHKENDQAYFSFIRPSVCDFLHCRIFWLQNFLLKNLIFPLQILESSCGQGASTCSIKHN